MPTYGVGFSVPFLVRDATTGAGVAGDAANLDLWLVAEGLMVAATNAPTEAAAYGGPPGWYALELTDAEAQADCLALCGVSTTPDAEVVPVTVTLERPADAWDVADGTVSYGERLKRVERRLVGGGDQRKADGLTRVYDDDGEAVLVEVRYSEDATYRYQTDEPAPS